MVQVAPHGVSILNLHKIISQKEPYVIIRFVDIVQCQCGMKLGKRSGTERMGEMPLWSARDKDEEGDVVIVKEERNNLKDAALDGRSVTFIKTINDNQTSQGQCIKTSCLEWLDNKRSELGFKGSSEDERVSLNGSDNLLPRAGDVDSDLVGNCCDKGFGVTASGIGAREEKGGEQELL